MITGFFAIVSIVNLWIWSNILFIQPYYGKLRYWKVQALSGLGFSTVILIYTIIGFFTLRYLLKKRLGVDNAEL